MIIKKIALILCVGITLTGCANVSSTNAEYVNSDQKASGPVFITKSGLPDNVEYEVIGDVKANARAGYASVETLYPMLADEARKVGANAVINVYGGRTVHLFSWAAPYTGGTAIKVKNLDSLKTADGKFL